MTHCLMVKKQLDLAELHRNESSFRQNLQNTLIKLRSVSPLLSNSTLAIFQRPFALRSQPVWRLERLFDIYQSQADLQTLINFNLPFETRATHAPQGERFREKWLKSRHTYFQIFSKFLTLMFYTSLYTRDLCKCVVLTITD